MRLIGEIGIKSHKQILLGPVGTSGCKENQERKRGSIWIEISLAAPACRRYHSICCPLASYMRVAICYFQERAAFIEGLRSSRWHNWLPHCTCVRVSHVTAVQPETRKSLLHSEKSIDALFLEKWLGKIMKVHNAAIVFFFLSRLNYIMTSSSCSYVCCFFNANVTELIHFFRLL